MIGICSMAAAIAAFLAVFAGVSCVVGGSSRKERLVFLLLLLFASASAAWVELHGQHDLASICGIFTGIGYTALWFACVDSGEAMP